MERTIKFIGVVADPNVKEVLPIAYYQLGKDTELIYIMKGETAILNEEMFAKVQTLVASGAVEVIQNHFNTDVVLAGLANVYDPAAVSPAPKDITATITHSIGHTLYEVDLMNANYEVTNKTTTSFDVKLKADGVSAADDIGYAVVVQK